MISPAVSPSTRSPFKFVPSLSPSKSDIAVEDLVVALHDFPSTSPSTNRYLSFKAGQLIRVINRDKSGWWDGEMILTSHVNYAAADLHSHTRGWFPSNYVTRTSTPSLGSFEASNPPDLARRPSVNSTNSSASNLNEAFSDSPTSLLTPSFPESYSAAYSSGPNSATTSSTRELQASSETDLCQFLWDPIVQAMRTIYSQAHHPTALAIQTATADIISAVRTVLDSTGCLGRDSPVLRPFPHLSGERKQLLSALACLVNQARKINPVSPQSPSFSDTSSSSLNVQPTLHQERRLILQLAHQVLSQVRSFLIVAERCGITLHSEGPTKRLNSTGFISNECTMPSIKPDFSQDSPRPTHSSKIKATLSNRPSSENFTNKLPSKLSEARTTTQHRRIGSGNSQHCIISDRPSLAAKTFCAGQILDITEKSHDQVLSTVAVFIGHAHIHSSAAHPASHAHLIDMTRDVIENVCELLVLVECISKNREIRPEDHSKQESTLVEARESLYVSTTSLVTAARVATSDSAEVSAGSVHEDDEADPLLASATAVLRAANGCMHAVSQCLSDMDPALGEFLVPSTRPSMHTSLSEDSCLEPSELIEADSAEGPLSQRTRHTLSMLGRKANSLALTRNPFESESRLAWSGGSSDWNRSGDIEGSSVDLSDAGSMYACETPFIVQEKSARGKVPNSPSSPSLSARSSSDGIEFVRRSVSSTTSSNGGYSRESSPATSTSVSHPEHDSFSRKDKRTTVMLGVKHSSIDFSNPSLHTQVDSVTSRSQDAWQQELLLNSDNQVIGGTLRGLVGRMTSHDTPVEASFFHSFFMTFRLFTTSEDLANALIARFALTFVSQCFANEQEPSNNLIKVTPIRLRVYNVMKSWLELHWSMKSDEAVLPVISKWAETLLSTVLPVPAERLSDLINKRMNESKLGIQPPGILSRIKAVRDDNSGKLPCPPPIISKALMSQFRASSLSLAALQLTEFDPTELARQITLVESELFVVIQPQEVFGQIFSKNAGLAVNVRAMSAMSTRMTGWFTEAILNEDDLRKRTQTLKFLIKLGAKLLEMQNYNALMSLMSSLNSSTILRLKRTWEGIGNKARALFENLNKAVSHQRNYAEYRATLRKAQTPCIPFLGVYLTDLTFCHEGNPAHRTSRDLPDVKLINFDKYQKIMKIMNEIERFQVPFNFTKVPQIVAYIRSSMENLVYQASADNLYQRSLKIEPREP